MNSKISIVHLSDTHNYNKVFDNLPEADLLLHTGDLTGMGSIRELGAVANKLIDIQHRYDKIIITAGNHDFGFQNNEQMTRDMFQDIVVLLDESFKYKDIDIYGSPYSTEYGDWAFMAPSLYLKEIWGKIPEDTQILMTHSPAYKLLDAVPQMSYDMNTGKETYICDNNIGCKHLLDRIQKVRPRLHLFGHIHEAYGDMNFNGIEHVNSSIMDGRYNPVNRPHLIKYSKDSIEIEVI